MSSYSAQSLNMSGEKAVFSTLAHIFEIDPETKKKWLPTSSKAVSVSFYHDPSRKTYRIISIESKKALVNSTITANMNFTKTSPKFGQWSDHRANTVYGLGFTSEQDLVQFVEKFNEAKSSARELLREKQNTTQRLIEQDKPQSPASFGDSSPGSPNIKSPSVISPPASTPGGSLKIPSPQVERESDDNRRDTKVSLTAMPNGAPSPKLPDSKLTNGHNSEHTTDTGQLETLKLENSRLKMALATSATNVKKWESEMTTLKNNNARLTTALEESTQHVAQWKQMLQKYKEENDQLKSKIERLESDKEAGADIVRRENDELKDVLSAVQIDLESNQEEVLRKFSENEGLRGELTEMSAKLQSYEEETQGLVGQVSLLEDQLKMASIASTRKLSEVQKKQGQVGAKLIELVQLHKEISSHLNT